jgi:hypothetical protein
MSRRGWIILLVGLGAAAAIGIGIFAVSQDHSQERAQDNFCSSLQDLESDVQALVSLDASSASKDDYQSDVSAIEDDWDQVKSDASDLTSIDTSTLDSSWDDFKSAVDDVPDDASASDALNDVESSAQSLLSTVKSTLTGPDCSGS